MTTYVVTAIIVALLSICARNYQERYQYENGLCINEFNQRYKFYVVLIGVVLIIVSGLRYDVGTDYLSYTTGYITRANRVWQDIIHYNEPGLGIIAFISRMIYDDYVTMFLLAAVVTVGLNVRTISKYSEDIYVGIMLYIFIGAWHGSFNGVRQYLAAAILFAGHRYILEKKVLKFLAVVFIASLFHTTALFVIPFYFLINIDSIPAFLSISTISSVVMRFSYDYLFRIMSSLKGHEQSGYTYMQTSVNTFRVLVAFAPLILYAFVGKQYFEEKEQRFYFKLSVINAIVFFATANSAYLARVGIYTDIYAVFAIPLLIRSFSRGSERILRFGILSLYFVFWLYEIYTRYSDYAYHWIFAR